jgi:hypothetical protein
MKWLFSVLFFAILIVGNISTVIAQDPRGVDSGGGPQDKGVPVVKSLSSLINEIFAPVTDKLNLTLEQQFQIIAIVAETEVRAGPLLQSLATADQQLSELSFAAVPDESRLKEISDQEATILSELIQMKVRAKAGIYRLLTTEQQAIVAQQFHLKTKPEGNLGSISIY